MRGLLSFPHRLRDARGIRMARLTTESARGAAKPSADCWSKRQAWILTGGGRAESLYTEERGYPFEQGELPHHHLLASSTAEAFAIWRGVGRRCPDAIVGAWRRTWFEGGGDRTTDADEACFNLQTPTIFIDLRIPTSRPSFRGCGRLEDLSAAELRQLARQHVFCGYTLAHGDVCTRHHALDWNFVGVPRSRPNKWTVAPLQGATDAWVEASFALDDAGAPYYTECWERLTRGSPADGVVLAMRAAPESLRDSFVVIIGDHFSYIRARPQPASQVGGASSLVDLVDDAVNKGDRTLAESFLSLEAGHGTISSGWMIDASIHPWQQGTRFLNPTDIGRVRSSPNDSSIISVELCGEQFHVLENSLASAAELQSFLSKEKSTS
ncbi:hypothetical protein AB1Y20_018105 [Prymnesium parvum]|uniref:Uncharacterized protein n=1 Tax=Prymnesium parvum TaxID=97485 RepID=A0AB34JQQ1_PRYPA